MNHRHFLICFYVKSQVSFWKRTKYQYSIKWRYYLGRSDGQKVFPIRLQWLQTMFPTGWLFTMDITDQLLVENNQITERLSVSSHAADFVKCTNHEDDYYYNRHVVYYGLSDGSYLVIQLADEYTSLHQQSTPTKSTPKSTINHSVKNLITDSDNDALQSIDERTWRVSTQCMIVNSQNYQHLRRQKQAQNNNITSIFQPILNVAYELLTSTESSNQVHPSLAHLSLSSTTRSPILASTRISSCSSASDLTPSYINFNSVVVSIHENAVIEVWDMSRAVLLDRQLLQTGYENLRMIQSNR